MIPRLLLPALCFLTACSSPPVSHNARESYFLTQVRPVFQQHCLQCHNGTLPPPALNLASKASAFTRSASGRDYILPAHPGRSLLISAVQRGGTHPKMMPRTALSLTEDQIGALREWIEDGAYWPIGEKGALRFQKSGENP